MFSLQQLMEDEAFARRLQDKQLFYTVLLLTWEQSERQKFGIQRSKNIIQFSKHFKNAITQKMDASTSKLTKRNPIFKEDFPGL